MTSSGKVVEYQEITIDYMKHGKVKCALYE